MSVKREYRRSDRLSMKFIAGCAVNSCMTVIVGWRATYKNEMFLWVGFLPAHFL